MYHWINTETHSLLLNELANIQNVYIHCILFSCVLGLLVEQLRILPRTHVERLTLRLEYVFAPTLLDSQLCP